MTEVKKGDFVTVTIRGEVSEVNDRDIVVGPFSGLGCTILPRDPNGHEVQVSIVEPAVEQFKPGDVVRHKHKQGFDRVLRALGDSGYIRLSGGSTRFYEYGASNGAYALEDFTSRDYEKVAIE